MTRTSGCLSFMISRQRGWISLEGIQGEESREARILERMATLS